MGVKTSVTEPLLFAWLTGERVEVVAHGVSATGRVTGLAGPTVESPTVTMATGPGRSGTVISLPLLSIESVQRMAGQPTERSDDAA
jgi:hypothetical protein